MATIQLEINGTPHSVDVPADMPLLWVLRDVLNLTGTKYGCGVGMCGSCVVHVNGRKERSCQYAVERAAGAKVTTIEGLSADGSHPLQTAWEALDVPQCGYCQPGQIMQAAALLARKPTPTDEDIDGVMVDNICRCGTYQRIRAAIHHAAEANGHARAADLPSALAAGAMLGAVLAGGRGGRRRRRARSRPRRAVPPRSGARRGLRGRRPVRRHGRRRLRARPRAWRGEGPAALDAAQRHQGRRRVPAVRHDGRPGRSAPVRERLQADGRRRRRRGGRRPTGAVALDPDRPGRERHDHGEPQRDGPGVRTSMAMIVADELDADWANVRIAQAQADMAKYGSQLTVGSMSTRTMWDTLRKAGATARTMVVNAAAEAWGVPAAECATEAGVVTHAASGRHATYGELAAAAAKQPVPAPSAVALKDPSAYRIIGKPKFRVDNAAVVNGGAVYGMDVRRPGMLHAVIARPPVFGGSWSAVDDAAARAVPGVKHVVTVPSGVAVAADTTWAALQGRDALKLTLDAGTNGQLDDAGVTTALEAALKPLADLPAGAAQTIEARFDLPYLAHATMEPMNCVAEVTATSCTLWAPTQDPGGLKTAVAAALKMDASAVTVNVTLLGGGFGRRAAPDFGIEAALVAKAVGAPVLLTWTRADDMQHDLYRPASVHRLRAAVDGAGAITGWQHSAALAINGGGNTNAQQATPLYAVPKPDIKVAAAALPVPSGYWRSVGLTQIVFSNESFLDEVARTRRARTWSRCAAREERSAGVPEWAVAGSGWGAIRSPPARAAHRARRRLRRVRRRHRARAGVPGGRRRCCG
ncbi:MAG: molybdopterin cofactor-binding domain-containing protein [Anaerolineae bacterium]